MPLDWKLIESEDADAKSFLDELFKVFSINCSYLYFLKSFKQNQVVEPVYPA